MRVWVLVIASVLLSVSVAFVVVALNRPVADDLEPFIPERALLDTVTVFVGESNGVELVLRPFYADPQRDRFNRREWNRWLPVAELDRSFARVWLINHREEPYAIPDGALCLVVADSGEKTMGAAEMADRGGDRIPEYFRAILRVWEGDPGEPLESGERVETAVAFASGREIAALPELESADGRVTLERRRVRLVDLLRYETEPSGRFADRCVSGLNAPRDREQAAKER